MGVHFQGRSNDEQIWASQCQFWSEAVSLYARQLLYDCPYRYNRLSFTPHDIVVAHTRSNRLEPWCIPDILKNMKFNEEQHRIELVSHIDRRYNVLNGRDPEAHDQGQQQSAQRTGSSNKTKDSVLSISGVSSMFNSMIQYVIPNGTHSETDTDYESDIDSDTDTETDNKPENGAIRMDDGCKVVYEPLMEELCTKMSNLSFYSKPTSSTESDLAQLLEIGTITFDGKGNEFMINGLVFWRFCSEVLRLTLSDLMVLKKWLLIHGQIKLFYLGDTPQWNESEIAKSFTTEILNGNLCISTVHELKDEMIYFNAKLNEMTISKEQMAKMQLLSIQMTMKRLTFQKSENEHSLCAVNRELMAKLQSVPSSKRKEVLQHHTVLLKKKKWLKQRIQTLDGSIFNLETTLNSMEDLTINKMVFEEMKNADKLMKSTLSEMPTVEDIEEMKDGIQQSMDRTNDIGQSLAKPMDQDLDVDEEELLREYEQMERDNLEEQLPLVPCHDIVVEEKENNDGDIDIDSNAPIEDGAKSKEMLLID